MSDKVKALLERSKRQAAQEVIPVKVELPVAERKGYGDETPRLHALSIQTFHQGKEFTEIMATVHGATGLVSKRNVVPGALTAGHLAALLNSISSW